MSASFLTMKRYSMQNPYAEWNARGKKLEPIEHLGTYNRVPPSPRFIRNFDASECTISFPKRGRKTIQVSR